MKKKRIGIFGGTFNPPHIGHVEAAKEFVKYVQLDELIIMPTFIPPHKELDSSVTCEERIEMCKLAFSEIEKAKISDLEISRGGKSYTYLTLQELFDNSVELYFLCGTDMILSMDRWKNPEIIFNLATICYIRRETDSDISSILVDKCKEYKKCFNARIIPIDSNVINISSSEIRSKIDEKSEYLPTDVLAYIRKKELY